MPSASLATPRPGFVPAVFSVSLAILLLQIALTRLLSVVLWYHFAFVAISLAMLGLALSGIVLYLAPRLMAATPRLVPWYCRLAGVTTVVALVYIMMFGRTPSGGSMLSLDISALYLCLLVPFTFAGFAISSILAYDVDVIGRLYSRDLAGAGLGCVAAVPLLDLAGAPAAVLVSALALLFGAFFAAPVRRRWIDVVLAGSIVALGAVNQSNAILEPKAMHGIPDEDPSNGIVRDYAAWNSHSRVVVSSVAEGIKSINIDGHATTGIYQINGTVDQGLLHASIPWMPLRAGSMPYVALGDAPSVFLIGPGGGIDVLNGLFYGGRITAVELNGLIYDLMSNGPIGKWAGDVYRAPGVRVFHDEARSWLRRSDERFDLIQASMIDTWAATAGGAFALAENSLYTVEAFLEYREHLNERGLVHFMRWHEQPPRQSLRMVSLLVEAMRRAGDPRPDLHVVVLEEPQFPDQGAKMASVLWSKRPFTEEALAKLEAAIVERSKVAPVNALCWPGRAIDNPLSSLLRASDPRQVIAAYPFDVSATTDDRPFFFHTRSVLDSLAEPSSSENEEAIMVLGTVLMTVSGVCVIAFLVPFGITIARRRLGGADALRKLGFFCCIGVGFMLVEIPMLQQMALYIGHPTWTLSTVLAALLLGAGCGGALTSAIPSDRLRAGLLRSMAAIIVTLVIAIFGIPRILDATMSWPFAARVMVTLTSMGTLGWFLGRALPLGMRAIGQNAVALVPWAWGLNGAASVLASVVAVVLAIEAGFTVTLTVGVGCYVLAALLGNRMTR